MARQNKRSCHLLIFVNVFGVLASTEVGATKRIWHLRVSFRKQQNCFAMDVAWLVFVESLCVTFLVMEKRYLTS